MVPIWVVNCLFVAVCAVACNNRPFTSLPILWTIVASIDSCCSTRCAVQCTGGCLSLMPRGGGGRRFEYGRLFYLEGSVWKYSKLCVVCLFLIRVFYFKGFVWKYLKLCVLCLFLIWETLLPWRFCIEISKTLCGVPALSMRSCFNSKTLYHTCLKYKWLLIVKTVRSLWLFMNMDVVCLQALYNSFGGSRYSSTFYTVDIYFYRY